MIKLGKAAKHLREKLELSQRAAADELGISFVHLCRIENGKASPSPEILERFRAAWGIDVYMFAVCLFGEPEHFPAALKVPMASLRRAWKLQLSKLIKERRRGVAADAQHPALRTS
jgi:transcriptional regulator with XRE-family HTH domain